MTRRPFIAPTDTLSLIPSAAQAKRSEPKRKRHWEKNHRGHSYFIPDKYRALVGVEKEDEGIRKNIRALAEKHSTTVGSIACALMDFSMSELRFGRLNLASLANPNGLKMQITWTYQNEGWPQTIPPAKSEPIKILKPRKLYLNYRWDARIDQQVIAEADRLDVPHGELVVRLLQHALDAYQSGRLRLKETAVVVKQKVEATWS